jgi:predicted acylesterase/phospholipase RssA
MRSLILAGGGVKVGFQAGVLQVWLDEAGLQFDHADGASGGCLNLAMYCEGRSGKEIAEAWRKSEPLAGVGVEFPDLLHARSLLSMERYRENVLRAAWRLDWPRIRASKRLGTFNLCNFTHQRLDVVENSRMDEDRLVSAISLPMWFRPVEIDGENYIDAVYMTDGNLEEAIRRGADEIWAIWTVSRRGAWSDGFVNQYFQIIEIAANGRFFQTWERIAQNNRAIAAGKPGEFGRHIEQKLLEAEVPIHYLLNFSHDRMAEVVNYGVAAARKWCAGQGIALQPGPPIAPAPALREPSGISFTEVMKGSVCAGVADPRIGASARGNEPASFELTIRVDDIAAFATDPSHLAGATGWVDVASLGGRRPVERGTFQLFVDDPNGLDKRMIYRLWFRDSNGRPFTLAGEKIVHDDPGFDLWDDTTTLFTRILRGHVEAGAEAAAPVWGAGVLRIHTVDLLRQLTTMRAHGPDAAARADAMLRFGRLFLGKLWDAYGHRILPFGPL